MPSRPVLIGRGLVPTTYTTTHPHRTRQGPGTVSCTPRATNEHHTVRVHYAVPNQQTRPTHTRGGGVERVERVTAAIAKRETPGPIPNPEVKPFSADGTATERLWESRTPPDKHLAGATSDLVAPVPFHGAV